MAEIEVVTCYECGKEFVDGYAFKGDPDKIFCSKKCVDDYVKKTKPANYCDECGKQLGNHYYTNGDKRYCSRKCGNKAIRRENGKCAECGKQNGVTTYSLKGRKELFCSNACSQKFARELKNK